MAVATKMLYLPTIFLVLGTKRLYLQPTTPHTKNGLWNHKYVFIYNFLKHGTTICLPPCTWLHKKLELFYKCVTKIMARAAITYIVLVYNYNVSGLGYKELVLTPQKIGLCNHKYVLIYNFLKQGRIICLLSCTLLHNNWGLS